MSNTQVFTRNPAWSRDELILALDLYVRRTGNPLSKSSPELLELSSLLNIIGRNRSTGQTYRNPNGVYMKTANFKRFDPRHIEAGRVGLRRGNRDEAIVWDMFAHDTARLSAAAEAIRANAGQVASDEPGELADVPEGFQEAEEGRLLTVQHVKRERSRKLVQAKKQAVLEFGGELTCEACSFDYGKTYGEHGAGYIECHHVQPLHTLRPGIRTTLADLALVCANRHRMIHAKAKWLTMDDLRLILRR